MQIYNEQLIKKWEELRLEAYLPTPHDVWTIGWGHTKSVSKGMKITEAQAQKFFVEDVAWVESAIAKHVKVPLSQNQYDALASWIFNVGEGNFASSTLLKKLNARDYEGAAAQFPRWNKQKGKVLKGLTRRRAEEMAYFLEGNSSQTEMPNATPDKEPPKPSLYKSKETLGGLIIAAISAATPLLNAKTDLPLTLICSVVALLGIGIILNRLLARKKGER